MPVATTDTDGCVRDWLRIRSMDVLVWTRGFTPNYTSRDSLFPWAYNVPAARSRVLVVPGVIVIGDDDGVVVVGRRRARVDRFSARPTNRAAAIGRLRIAARLVLESGRINDSSRGTKEVYRMSLRVLFVGGTGNISLPCVAAAVKAGHQVTLFNRGASEAPAPIGVASVVGDITDDAAYRELGKTEFDVVCQFIIFTREQMERDIETFSRVGQYIFISSASIYEKPPRNRVITEKTPTVNPYWPYSQNKIACEAILKAAKGTPWTIVRPSHTVRTMLPTMFNEDDIVARRMLEGRPVIVCGDGSTQWTLTRSEDFAPPFVGLFGKSAALGEDFHITSDNAYTWDDIYRTMADGLGVKADIVHVPTDTLVRYHPEWEGPLIGDKTWPALFDNTKVKQVVGDFEAVKELRDVLTEPIAHFKARSKPKGPQTDELHRLMDLITREQRSLGHQAA